MMGETDSSTMALKLAEAILLHNGSISLEDVKALPFLEDSRDAELIVSHLKAKFKTKSYLASNQSANLRDWEEILILNSAI